MENKLLVGLKSPCVDGVDVAEEGDEKIFNVSILIFCFLTDRGCQLSLFSRTISSTFNPIVGRRWRVTRQLLRLHYSLELCVHAQTNDRY